MFKKFFKSKNKEEDKKEDKLELENEKVDSEENDESNNSNVEETIEQSQSVKSNIEESLELEEDDNSDEEVSSELKTEEDVNKDGEVSLASAEDNDNNDIQDDEIEDLNELDESNNEEVNEIENDTEETQEPQEENLSMFERLKQGLSKAKSGITDKIDAILKSYTKVDEELLEDLEEILITSDVGVNTTLGIIDSLRDKIKEKGITDPMDVREELKNIVEDILNEENSKLDINPSPCIILMVGVNGVGKTTTIGKLATRYKKDGKKVLLAAADTFRAAATEQLDIWANRANVDIIKHSEGADPGAVVFDAVKAAKARNVDVLICDTAGRLHNKTNLMNELGKIFKIVEREFPEAKREVLLVVDATTGQNAVSQAKTFKEVADITGIVLTKLDGTAKGGVVLAVKSEVDVPVKLIGVGEKAEDLQDFDPKLFTDALFGN